MSFKLMLLFVLFVYTGWATPKQKPVQIAFLSDVHLQDIYGTLSDTPFKGILNPVNGKMATIRTMKSQLNSTRLFNENYFAFLAALDDLGHRGVKLIALPGDFSDDGQPINVEGLRRILADYQQKYGMSFFITCGNHDPVRPFVQEAGKPDFMGPDGREQAVVSKAGLFQTGADALPAVVSPSVKTLGYGEISEILRDYGFYPQPQYLYWETPFSSYHSATGYGFSKALAESDIALRRYTAQPNNLKIPDLSYLVEPVPGVWLLAIDANVYVPKTTVSAFNDDAANYSGSGIGYDQVLRHKKYLCEWVAQVARRAKAEGKTLIAFSHYPMIEFNNQSTENIERISGKNMMQTARIPTDSVARFFADVGIRLHFAGHMHLNNTGLYRSPAGNPLCNIQVPSLAAYAPGYKLLTIRSEKAWELETVSIDSIARFNELFPLYDMEFDRLQSIHDPKIWKHDILNTRNYHQFAREHLRELVRLRFIPEEWPTDFTNGFMPMTGRQILEIFGAEADGLQVSGFESWTGYDFLQDLYALYNANEIALKDISLERQAQYRLLVAKAEKWMPVESGKPDFRSQVQQTVTILGKLMNAHPNAHFILIPESGGIVSETSR